MKTFLLSGTLLAASAAMAFAQNTRASLPNVEDLPEGTVQVSGVVPRMGEHWVREADNPIGPIYCVHDGKVICLEFMIAQEDFVAGKSWEGLAGMEGLPPVNHIDITFLPEGHPGYEVRHYDIHLYFLSPEEIAAIE